MESQVAPRLCRPFTLVEMLTAIALLVIIMGFLFQVLVKAQEAWSLAETQRRIYERAQIVFETVGRDVMCSAASPVHGRVVPIWVNPNQTDREAWADQDVLCVVSHGPAASEDCAARFNETRYSLFTDADDNDTSNPDAEFVLRRSTTSDTSSGLPNTNWDFLGAQNGTWVSTAAARQSLVDGVWSFRVTPFPALSGNATRLPAAIQIRIELFDPKALQAPTTAVRDQQIAETRRQFTKLIFLAAR